MDIVMEKTKVERVLKIMLFCGMYSSKWLEDRSS